MTIKWDERFSVGHSAIDAEHKLLLTIINALEMALRHPEDKVPLLFFIDQLHEVSQAHFHHEEAMQLRYMYPFREDNARGHEMLTLELNRIRKDIHAIAKKATLSVTDLSDLHKHISYLAKSWLMDHVVKEDLKMKGFMNDS